MPDANETHSTNAVALLKADHRKVEDLFEKFENARGASRKAELVKEIVTELSVHASIEEEIFYPACVKAVEEDMLNEAHVEHDEAKVLMSELLGGTPEDEFYDAKVKVLSELIKHHVHEEEMRGGIFAQVRDSEMDVEALGKQMQARKEELLEKIKTNGLPKPITRSFTGHDLEQGERVETEAA